MSLLTKLFVKNFIKETVNIYLNFQLINFSTEQNVHNKIVFSWLEKKTSVIVINSFKKNYFYNLCHDYNKYFLFKKYMYW